MTTDHHHANARRRLVLIDVENLLGGEPRHASAALFAVAVEGLLQRIGYCEGRDYLVVGVCPETLPRSFGIGPAHRLVLGAGESGADRALCAVVEDSDFVASRFDHVVVASGDREFLGSVVQLKARGVYTTVAARPGSLNPSMSIVADEVVELLSARDLLGLALAA